MSQRNASHQRVASEPVEERRVHVFQGHYEVSDAGDLYFSTILGSCVAACLRDPVAGVGGMNHFLVPGEDRADTKSLSYGIHSMELLINGLLKLGAQRHRLEAKLFGGGKVVKGVLDIGEANAIFAREFLARENIPCVSESLGGNSARRLQFWPASGRARLKLVPIEAAPPPEPIQPQTTADDSGDAEFF